MEPARSEMEPVKNFSIEDGDIRDIEGEPVPIILQLSSRSCCYLIEQMVARISTQVSDSTKEEMPKDKNKNIDTDYIHPHSLNSGVPVGSIQPPNVGGEVSVDEAVLEGIPQLKTDDVSCLRYLLTIAAFPVPGTKLKSAHHYGSSVWALTAKLVTELPDGSTRPYFLKV
jgi:hypothetical protein